jgi:hypothetical protein
VFQTHTLGRRCWETETRRSARPTAAPRHARHGLRCPEADWQRCLDDGRPSRESGKGSDRMGGTGSRARAEIAGWLAGMSAWLVGLAGSAGVGV